MLFNSSGDYESKDVVGLVRDTFSFIADYEGEIPGAAARDCGNYLDQNLPMAKYLAKKYLNEALNNPSDKKSSHKIKHKKIPRIHKSILIRYRR